MYRSACFTSCLALVKVESIKGETILVIWEGSGCIQNKDDHDHHDNENYHHDHHNDNENYHPQHDNVEGKSFCIN